jgi:PadR family transcriptional regulator, regulatory protein PadR
MPPAPAPLGELEAVILMAVLHLSQDRDDAFGSAIRDQIEQRSGRRVSRGSIYVTLDRLEDKGLLLSRLTGASKSRAGRPKRLFRVTPLGVKAVKHSVALVVRMHTGLEPLLGTR